MKKVVLCFTALLLLYAACKPDCNPKIPKGVQPIDWENYNDVYTVKWNYTGECSSFNTYDDNGPTIKVYGWIFHPQEANPYDFTLLSDSLFVEGDSYKCASVFINFYSENIEEKEHFKTRFYAADRTKRCYVVGKLRVLEFPDNNCCTTAPAIVSMNADDIYFE